MWVQDGARKAKGLIRCWHVYALIKLVPGSFYDGTQAFMTYVCLTIEFPNWEFRIGFITQFRELVYAEGILERFLSESVFSLGLLSAQVVSFASLLVGQAFLNSVFLNCVNQSGFKWVCCIWRHATLSRTVGSCKSRIQQGYEVQ